ncbi:hypothetical protein NEIFL0001_2156 [Neisseria flavescens SK114]|nr:hypothetical protein NEIFL0001_2156 [Neisseria flavescens SK114]
MPWVFLGKACLMLFTFQTAFCTLVHTFGYNRRFYATEAA